MTMVEMIREEMARAQKDIDRHKKLIDEVVAGASHTAACDHGATMAGVGLAHAALEICSLSGKYHAAGEQLSMLEYILREAEDGPEKASKAQ